MIYLKKKKTCMQDNNPTEHHFYLDLEHLVPLCIWIIISCPLFIIWEVLLADTH